MDLKLSGKIAVVTGASKGIGLAVTRALVEEGARVVAGARSTQGLEGLAGVTAVAVDHQNPVSRHGARNSDRSRPMTNSGHFPAVSQVSRDELRAKLAGGEPFKLVMAASDFGFRAKHIPGSIHFGTHGASSAHADRFQGLDEDDDIVVYCSNVDCNASRAAIAQLLARGYRKVRHYAGGLIDWESARLPVEGDWAGGPESAR
jgi:NAD(P)-dependent dehydrogenase (short-subunit alcohol dehydrogenase family)